MEIFTLLETLEDILEKSRNVPFSSKCIVDKEEVLDIIKEIRLKLPDELKQAKWVKEERQKILVQAQSNLTLVHNDINYLQKLIQDSLERVQKHQMDLASAQNKISRCESSLLRCLDPFDLKNLQVSRFSYLL